MQPKLDEGADSGCEGVLEQPKHEAGGGVSWRGLAFSRAFARQGQGVAAVPVVGKCGSKDALRPPVVTGAYLPPHTLQHPLRQRVVTASTATRRAQRRAWNADIMPERWQPVLYTPLAQSGTHGILRGEPAPLPCPLLALLRGCAGPYIEVPVTALWYMTHSSATFPCLGRTAGRCANPYRNGLYRPFPSRHFIHAILSSHL